MTLFYSDGWNMVHGNVKHYDDTDEGLYKVIDDHDNVCDGDLDNVCDDGLALVAGAVLAGVGNVETSLLESRQ